MSEPVVAIEALVVGREPDRLETAAEHLARDGFQADTYDHPAGVLARLYNRPPQLIVFDCTESEHEAGLRKVLQSIKQDAYFNLVPLIALLEPERAAGLEWSEWPVDDFVSVSEMSTLPLRARLALSRLERMLDSNPLSRLPGNFSIERRLRSLLARRARMAVCYLDIGDFKPFNDRFGFNTGDDVIRITARILGNSVSARRGPEDSEGTEDFFVGHIGGDDFLYIVPLDQARAIGETVIAAFDELILSFLPDEALVDGRYRGRTREGKESWIPVPRLVIAALDASRADLNDSAGLAEEAMALKKQSQAVQGSCFMGNVP